MPNAIEILPGAILVIDDELFRVLEAHPGPDREPGHAFRSAHAARHGAAHRHGDGHGSLIVTLQSLDSGSPLRRRFRSDEPVEFAAVSIRRLEYLYAKEGVHHFMDPTSFEQIVIDAGPLAASLPFMRVNDVVDIELHGERPVGVLLPDRVPLVVAVTGPVTAPAPPDSGIPNVFKDATLETGITIRVPLDVETGETIRVDTRTGQFVERVS